MERVNIKLTSETNPSILPSASLSPSVPFSSRFCSCPSSSPPFPSSLPIPHSTLPHHLPSTLPPSPILPSLHYFAPYPPHYLLLSKSSVFFLSLRFISSPFILHVTISTGPTGVDCYSPFNLPSVFLLNLDKSPLNLFMIIISPFDVIKKCCLVGKVNNVFFFLKAFFGFQVVEGPGIWRGRRASKDTEGDPGWSREVLRGKRQLSGSDVGTIEELQI